MLHPANASTEERRKVMAELQHAIPVTRMVDYGVPTGDALHVHASTAVDDPPLWDEVCEQRAQHHMAVAAEAERLGRRLTAAQAFRAASALLQCGQLALHTETPRKTMLYEQAHAALEHHARHAGDLETFARETRYGALYGWLVRPTSMPAEAAVVIIGGLGGWAGAYLDTARALTARGMLAILSEGPGQGLTRMRSGIHLGPATRPLLGEFLAHAQRLPAARLGVWGNSFGGLLAAGLAVADERVQAVCVNGAPMVPAVPPVGSAREQLQAMFGATAEHELSERCAMLALDPQRDHIAGSLLVVQGGRDALIPPSGQVSFLALAEPDRRRLLTWEDGEHTIYNHAEERNALVADWFAQQLSVAT